MISKFVDDSGGPGWSMYEGCDTLEFPAEPTRVAFDWMVVWLGCERRLRSWRVPPRWSARDWLEEMRAEGAAAALLATRDYQPGRNVPLGAYVRMRIMGQVLSRYRKEWAYALHQASADRLDETGEVAGTEQAALLHNELTWALGHLRDTDRWLIERLFWREETEAEIARTLGLSQQAVNKRKRHILDHLRNRIPDDSK